LFAVLATLMVALTAGTALAALNLVKCPTGPGGKCVGTANADNIRGTSRADDIKAYLGNDQIHAFGGADDVTAGPGADTTYGYGGGDTINGSTGNDFLHGGADGDVIIGGADNDRTRGEDGNDSLRVAGDTSNRDYVNCGAGSDTAFVDSNDVVDEAVAQTLVVNTATSCERLFVNGILIPTGP